MLSPPAIAEPGHVYIVKPVDSTVAFMYVGANDGTPVPLAIGGSYPTPVVYGLLLEEAGALLLEDGSNFLLELGNG